MSDIEDMDCTWLINELRDNPPVFRSARSEFVLKELMDRLEKANEALRCMNVEIGKLSYYYAGSIANVVTFLNEDNTDAALEDIRQMTVSVQKALRDISELSYKHAKV